MQGTDSYKTSMPQVLGQTHPATSTSIVWLAMCVEDQGRYSEAEVLYRQALAT